MRYVLILAALMAWAAPASGGNSDPLEMANQALIDGDLERAVALYTPLLEDKPDDGLLNYNIGKAYEGLGKLEKAEQHLLKAGEAGYRAQGVGYWMARIRAQQGDSGAAIGYLQEIAEAGFPAPALIENEADFDPLRQEPGFVAALDAIRANRFPCENRAESRGFDFWQGHWNVTSQGQQAGENRIESILGGCVLFENWTNVAGQSGKSFNFWDAGEKHWRQIWVDDTGGVLDFTGEIRDGVMHYEAVTHDPDSGAETLHRMSFTPNEDGSVRQLMEASNDKGETWQVSFDGHYTRKLPEVASAAIEQ